MSVKIEAEIFERILEVVSNPENKDRYGQVSIFNHRESHYKKVLSEEAFQYLSDRKSIYGAFNCYGGKIGQYYALTLSDKFYRDRNNYKK